MHVEEIIKTVPNVLLLGYGGSHAYGTNIPTSDIDIRGIYMNSLDEFIGIKKDSETKEIPGEDTVLYSLKKMIQLLSQCNPNTIEILGLRPEDYLYISKEGQMLLQYKHLFLSKRAVFTFGQYAKAQLNRLINKSGRSKDEVSQNETRSLQKALASVGISKDKFWITDGDTEQIVTVNGIFSLSEFIKIYQAVDNVHTDYRSSVRNNKAVEHGKLNKHMMHLIRLYMMGIDILTKHEIITYRADEHNLLMDIRNGKYLEADLKTPTKEFEELLAEYQRKFDEASNNTTLPEKVDMEAINNLMINIVTMYYRTGDTMWHIPG